MAMDIRHCIRCGKAEPEVTFRSDLALKCEACDAQSVQEKRLYHKRYHAARHRAVMRLIEKHPKQFRDLMVEEMDEQTKGADAELAVAAAN